MTNKTFYVTTPIFYVNGAPHIGHAYTMLAADVLARFKRLDGYEVFFLTGTDEHGQKVEAAARSAGLNPQAFTDEVAAGFKDLALAMNISNDEFIRTTEPRHKATVQAIWQRLEENGAIYLGAYEGWYAVRDEAFYNEDETSLQADGTRIATTSGAPVIWLVEPSYFFRLNAFQEPLLKLYENNPSFMAPNGRRNEIMSFVRSGLNDLSISRTSFSWGIPVPDDKTHVMYVWLDALLNYLTVTGFPDANATRGKFWPPDVQIVGKDIIRFHAVYWPAFLMAANLPLPHQIYAHGWWTVEGEKMSKSLNNAIDVRPLIAEFGLDTIRFFLLREIPFGNDGDFSRRALIARTNAELANGIGNLAQRTLSFIAKNADGRIPVPAPYQDADHALLAQADALPDQVRTAMTRLAFNEALEEIWRVIRAADGYIDHQAPWTLRKTDTARMNTVLFVLVVTLRSIAILLQPFMPERASQLLNQLGVPESARQIAALEVKLEPGTTLPAPAGLFPRFVEPS